MSNQENRTCKGCHVRQSYENFLNDKGVALKKCLHCRDKLKIARLSAEQSDAIINYSDITETIYYHLISLNDTNELYEGENVELNLDLDIELSSFLDFISEKDDLNKENLEIEVSNHVITLISEGDGIHGPIIGGLFQSRKAYCHDTNPLLSAKCLLEEFNQEIIVNNLNTSAPALGFLTELFYKLIYYNFEAIEIDATYGTNNLAWELYAIMGVIDGTGFPLSYLIISVGKSRNITGILTQWMQALKEQNLRNFPFILTDKDFSEINAAQTVWPQARLQLCVWHLRRAIKQRLSSNKIGTYYSYNPKVAHEECSSIDPSWGIVNNSNLVFCPLKLRKTVISIVENHSNRHMLLPKHDGTFITNADEIWKECVKEMIEFCKENELLQLWVYLWRECHIKTTMIVESHWRHIKHDHLYKFRKPRVDHLCFILVKKVISQQLYRIQLLQQGRYSVPWRKEFKKEWKQHEKKTTQLNGKYLQIQQNGYVHVQRNGNYPLISSYEGELVNVFGMEAPQNYKVSNILLIQNSITENEDDYIIESDNEEQQTYETDFAYLCEVLDKAKELLKESYNKPKRHLWLKNVRKNFRLLEKMNNDIKALENRRTMPKTWKNF
ncbi:ATP-dependent DNA helicase PIF1 [Rhizophagus irregularis DAOM 181602=DAOM 197198]|nr:ATP-dependent DNA helicase PIF1 [Rhizophagus irregularis DAOM 181602=DAOM 197198]